MRRLFLVLVLLLFALFSLYAEGDFVNKREDNIKVFVDRLYRVVLDRAPDEGGEMFWINYIQTPLNAKETVKFFVNSEEFRDRNLSNEEFVKEVFLAFTQTLPSEEELKEWVSRIDKEGREVLIDSLEENEYFDILVNSFLNEDGISQKEYIEKIIEKLEKDKKGFYNVDAYKAYMLQNLGVKFFDVRTREEYEKSHPIHSINVPVYNNEYGRRVLNEEFIKDIENFEDNRTDPLIVMCAHGHRSKTAAEILIENGYKNVINVKEGFSDNPGSWEKLSLPVEKLVINNPVVSDVNNSVNQAIENNISKDNNSSIYKPQVDTSTPDINYTIPALNLSLLNK